MFLFIYLLPRTLEAWDHHHLDETRLQAMIGVPDSRSLTHAHRVTFDVNACCFLQKLMARFTFRGASEDGRG